MRVLWLCNMCLPVLAEQLGLPVGNKEGWLSGLSNRLLLTKEAVTLAVCFPTDALQSVIQQAVSAEFTSGDQSREAVVYAYSFYEDTCCPEVYDKRMETRMKEILADFQPDIVHLFGTEYAHGLAMTNAVSEPKKILVGIQGMCTACAKVYTDGIPERIVKRNTLRDWLKKDNILKQQQKFLMRAENEQKLLQSVGNVTGRTACDNAFTQTYAPNAKYFFMNETLRNCFYDGLWNEEAATKHQILISQADYPIKGFHRMIEELPEIIEAYPDTTVSVCGNAIIGEGSLKKRVLISSYGKYLRELAEKYGVRDHISFRGMLNAKEMKEAYLSTNVFVCCSLTENSPNCIGEAMLLGVPTVAANVGGIKDLMVNEQEGFLYESGYPGALAKAVIRVFRENGSDKQRKRSEAARAHARNTHNADQNTHRLLEIYEEMLSV